MTYCVVSANSQHNGNLARSYFVSTEVYPSALGARVPIIKTFKAFWHN